MAGKIRFDTTSGMRGLFPVMRDDDGPIQTGMTCRNYEECKIAAIEWAKAEFGDGWKDHTSLREGR